ncbi:MAG TPA: N-acetyl-gamma-glutamyl-phosphate reductase, partial [Kofleriaceae bacterium]
MAKRFKAAIIGGSGYGGAEMARRLLMHPDVELVRVASIDHVGEPLGAVHPNLDGATDLVFEDLAPAEAARGCDVALLALPHKVTAAKVPELIAAGVKIVDMSGDFRLRDAATYEKYYGARHPHPELLGSFVYGLPELNRAEIKRARYVASPGCFATAMELALLPLARAGLLDHATVHVTGITGSSGSGIAPGAGTHHPSRAGNLKTYKPLEHQHVPEVVQTLGDAGARAVQLRFVPVSAPLTRGIFATCFVELDA